MEKLIRKILENDRDPPSEEYSPAEFGEQVAAEVLEKDSECIVRACWERLPGSLAESFLSGFLDASCIHSLDKVLLDCIATTREIGSVSSIVRMLEERCDLDGTDICRFLLEELARTPDKAKQNRLAYAVRASRCANVETSIRKAMKLDLSDYAKSCLADSLGRNN